MTTRVHPCSGVPTPTLPRVHYRLTITVVAVSVVALAGVIATMWVTEFLPSTIRWPVVLVLLVLVSILWSSVMRRQVTRLIESPLEECVAAAEAIAQGETSKRLPPGETFEFDLLASSINRTPKDIQRRYNRPRNTTHPGDLP